MTNIYSFGSIEAAAKIAAIEGAVDGTVNVGSIYIKLSASGTLGSAGAEGKIGRNGIKVGLHAIVGGSAGIEWGSR